jgi:hypothetical protein
LRTGLLKALGGHLWLVESLKKGKSSLSVNEVLGEVRRLSELASTNLARSLAEYFQDTHGQLLRGATFSVNIDDETFRRALNGLGMFMGEPVTLQRQNIAVAAKAADPKGSGYLTYAVSVEILYEIAGAPVTLPAERNALVMTYKMLNTRRYRVLRDQARALRLQTPQAERQLSLFNEPGDIRYPKPIEDFLDFLTDLELDLARAGIGRIARAKIGQGSSFEEIAALIEEHIQGGHRTHYQPTSFGGHELTVSVRDDLDIDLYNASSSIKQLAPLLLYLRYRAARGQTLIIDEPEMNLHPEAQAKLLEALAMLANLGVRILLTTHSPYFMAHLNNLIAADQRSTARRRRQAAHLYMQDPAAFLSPDDVSAYEMRPDGLASLHDPEYGIRWDTLSDVSAELQRRYFAIVEEPVKHAKTS